MKRLLTAIIGLPIVIAIFVLGNKYVIDFFIAIIAIISLHEYFKCIELEVKPISWLGYFLAACIAFIHILGLKIYLIIICIGIPTILLILFLHIVITNMKINLKDVAFSFLGIIYILSFISFIPLIYGLEGEINLSLTINHSLYTLELLKTPNLTGKYLIWILMITTWGSDIFAYEIGKHFGKHKFSKVSPNKTIEGCIAGVGRRSNSYINLYSLFE